MESSFVFRPVRVRSRGARGAGRRERSRVTTSSRPTTSRRASIDIYTQDTMNLAGSEARNAFANLVRQRLLSGRLDELTSARVVSSAQRDSRRFSVTKTGRDYRRQARPPASCASSCRSSSRCCS